MQFLVVANGERPSRGLFTMLHQYCDSMIGADGGGHTALAYGYRPDAIVGDLDSFPETGKLTCEIIHNPDQETNDLEKALDYALTHGATRVDVIGATGLRTDQTLKNLSVLQQFSPRFEHLAFWDDQLYMRIVPKSFSIELPPGNLVSLFPMSGKVKGIKTSGLRYPLNNETLRNGYRDGSSNVVIDGSVTITYQTGALLFMTATGEHLVKTKKDS
ncbi:thiamine diphosphokinase [Natronogracilivirga saccharolytica]|uniref:Thiamine diphosphokinase n=1 Tax=Natronogracilivirga saccharolytica TaxID=2812953 RepID=A0A8J7SA36_9BACT|nr:thiamine diphosphokinase [Natronogracilivirga saccharolytica]MBP3192836.1 thiamine diphosphokinase [Natronogracilivirga saccharolytica]